MISNCMEKTATCKVIKPENPSQGKQNVTYFGGISAQNSGAQGICMHLTAIPPRAQAKAHLHEDQETAIYVLTGKAAMWFGDNLADHLTVEAGEYLYIPAGMPHLPYNPSETKMVTALIARTDPNEQESVVLLPELDRLVAKRSEETSQLLWSASSAENAKITGNGLDGSKDIFMPARTN